MHTIKGRILKVDSYLRFLDLLFHSPVANLWSTLEPLPHVTRYELSFLPYEYIYINTIYLYIHNTHTQESHRDY